MDKLGEVLKAKSIIPLAIAGHLEGHLSAHHPVA